MSHKTSPPHHVPCNLTHTHTASTCLIFLFQGVRGYEKRVAELAADDKSLREVHRPDYEDCISGAWASFSAFLNNNEQQLCILEEPQGVCHCYWACRHSTQSTCALGLQALHLVNSHDNCISGLRFSKL